MRSALAELLNTPLHTLFHVSTSRALVQGTYSGAVTCQTLLAHGDFGLGTFEGLDGEMVVLDGAAYRATADGRVTKARDDSAAPFAVVTRFSPAIEQELRSVASFDELAKQCNAHRRSDNLFYAFRIDGTFTNVQTRAVSPPKNHGHLLDAAKVQKEFKFSNVEGTLVGIYSPGFSDSPLLPEEWNKGKVPKIVHIDVEPTVLDVDYCPTVRLQRWRACSASNPRSTTGFSASEVRIIIPVAPNASAYLTGL